MPDTEAGVDAMTPDRRARVATVHAQARQSLCIAGGFVLAAVVAALIPHRTGDWLPLHLFLIGGVLSAICGATQLLAVTWSAAPAPKPIPAAVPRWGLALGAAGLALTRELGAPVAAIAASGMLVTGALLALAVLLVQVRAKALHRRFHPAIDGYLAAVAVGVGGTIAGLLLATNSSGEHAERLRAAHVVINLLGLVGLVIAATIPYFAATQLRTKVSRRATPFAVRAVVAVLGAAAVTTAGGCLFGRAEIVRIGFAASALGVAALFALLPPLHRKQLGWAGPRILQLFSGMLWWAAITGLLAASATDGEPLRESLLLALVIGGYAQILLGSLAYFGPVLRGGGHRRLTDGFLVTRSWLSLVAGNCAAVAALTQHDGALQAILVVWGVDLLVRALRLAHRSPS
jgi:nitrite reductase (NO-forming)